MRKLVVVLLLALALLPMAARAQLVDTMWSRDFDAGGAGMDLLGDMAVDAAGNVFATGIGHLVGGHDAMWTMACNQWGVKLWTTRHC